MATYGDLIRVPGSATSLEKEKANGHDIRIIYSVLEAVEIARNNDGKPVIFLGIGFETTVLQRQLQSLRQKKIRSATFSY